MIIIRNAYFEDFNAIFILLTQLYENNTLTEKKTLELFLLELKNKNSSQIVALKDNNVVGFAVANNRVDFKTQGKISMLICLIVKTGFRDIGIGKKLLKTMENICKNKDSKKLQLSSTFKRNGAHEFYESQGYKKTAFYFFKAL